MPSGYNYSFAFMRGTKTQVAQGVWRFRVYVGRRPDTGSPMQVSRTFRGGARAADRALAALVGDVIERHQVADTATSTERTVGQLLDEWLKHIEGDRSPTTLREYRRLTEKVVRPVFGDVKLKKLTAYDLDSLYGSLRRRARPLSPTSVRRVHALLSAALHQGEKWGWVERSVAHQASPPPVRSNEPHTPQADEVLKVIAEADKSDRVMAALLATGALTGARRGELCALRWSDLDEDAAILTIVRSVFEMPGGGWGEKDTKTHQVRRVGLDEVALRVLGFHRERVETRATDAGVIVRADGFMFSRSPAGVEPVRPDFVTKFTMRLANKLGITVTAKALRHFSATEMVAAGVDVRTVAGRMGHADPSMTFRVYSHRRAQRDREAAVILGKTLPDLSTEHGRPRSKTRATSVHRHRTFTVPP